MIQEHFSGPVGLARLKAHMQTLYAERKQGTGIGWDTDYFRGLLHGLSLAEAIGADISLAAHDFINERGFERP